MRKIYFFFLILAAISCHKEQVIPGKGNAAFLLSTVVRPQSGGRIAQTSTPAFVLLSIEDGNGKTVLQNKKLSLFTFGQSYISESLELTEGSYKIVQFQVLNAGDTVIYASPLVGSALAQYVTNPLPINFSITKDVSTQVIPQVLAVSATDAPLNFGYASFGFEVVSVANDSLTVNFVFDPSTNYDSISIVFKNGTTIAEKKLKIGNGTATVHLLKSELSGNGICGNCWHITLSGFFENISYQYKESRVTSSVQLAANVSEINIDWMTSTVSITPTGSALAQFVNYVHGIDEGNYHIEVNADTPCDPHLLLSLRSGIIYAYLDKTLYYKTLTDSLHALYYNYVEPTGPFQLDQILDVSAKFNDVNKACGVNNWNGNFWNYADVTFYAESNGVTYSWYYSWSK